MGLQNLPLWLLLIPPKRNTELPMPDPTAPDDLLSMGERPTKPLSRRKRNSPTEPCGRPRSENPSQSQIRRSQNLVRVCWKGCFGRWNDHHRILSPSRLGSNVKKLSPIQNLHIGYHTPFTFPAKTYFPLHQRPLTSPPSPY